MASSHQEVSGASLDPMGHVVSARSSFAEGSRPRKCLGDV